MKKLLPLIILLAVFSGCSKSYMAEREYYKAEKVLESVREADVQERGAEVLQPVIDAFSKVIEKYPGTGKALQSHFLIAGFYERLENYEAARKTLGEVVVNFSRNLDDAAQARFQIAGLYDKEGNWGEAESLYWETAEYSSLQLRGLQAPIQIILHYRKMNYADAQKRVYEKALQHYDKLLERLGPIERSSQVRNYKAIAHTVVGNWKEARDEWLSLSNDFPESTGAPLAMIAAAEATEKSGEEALAISLYDKYLENYPDHAMSGQINVRLGIIKADQGRYTKAREHYKNALTQFQKGQEGVAQISDVKLLIARSYQTEGKWSDAKKRYHALEEHYPNTVAGMQVPLLIARYYEHQGQVEKSHEVLDAAIAKYDEVATQHPLGSTVNKLAWRLKNDAYQQKGDWSLVYSQLDEAITVTEDAEERGKLLLSKAMIAESKAKDADLALKFYEDFLKTYSEHPLAQTAKDRVKVLTQGTLIK